MGVLAQQWLLNSCPGQNNIPMPLIFHSVEFYQAVVRSILLYGCETWPVRVADERMLEVFDNDSISHPRKCGAVSA